MSNLNLNANAACDKIIRIGYKGENIVTSITFDLKAWVESYGLGVVTLLVQRHGDTSAYLVPLTIEDGSATWLITNTDCAKSGKGAIQLVYTVGEKVKKSPVFAVTTSASLDGSDDPPDPYDSWLATLTELTARATAASAESLANAESAQTSANNAATSEANARTYAESASAYLMTDEEAANLLAAAEGESNE